MRSDYAKRFRHFTPPNQIVIPAKAGIQDFFRTWIPAYAGMTSKRYCFQERSNQ